MNELFIIILIIVYNRYKNIAVLIAVLVVIAEAYKHTQTNIHILITKMHIGTKSHDD